MPALPLVVVAGIAAAAGLDGIKEVVDDLAQRNQVMQVNARFVHILHVDQHAALRLAQVHQRADVIVRRVDVRVDERLLLLDDAGRVGVGGGVVDDLHRAVGQRQAVLDARRRRDKVKVKLALKTLGDDLHVEQAQKAATEAEAQRGTRLRLKSQARVVELQFLQRVLQVGIVRAVGGVDAAEHHRRDRAEAGHRLRCGVGGQRDGIADAGVAHGLDAGRQVADLTGLELVTGGQARRAHVADLHQLELRAGAHQADGIAGFDRALKDADVDDDALVAVVDGVEDQRLQRCVGVAGGGGDIPRNAFQHLLDADAQLGRDARCLHAGQADDVLDLLRHGIRVGTGQVDLVQNRHDLQIVVQRQIAVRQRLRLNALAGVDDEDCALAGGQTAADLVLEVHMARGVDEVELVGLAVVGLVAHRDGAGLDGDAALLLDVHVVQHLVGHGALVDAVGQLQHTVRQSGLAVVDVGNNAKVADVLAGHQVSSKLFQISQILPFSLYTRGTRRARPHTTS